MVRELAILKEYDLVNQFLKNNGWFFVCPFFFVGGDLSYLGSLSKMNGDQHQKIRELMVRKFYQLESTASFVDGYCLRCSYMEPFLLSIEHSIILAFQRDYEGAIKTLIPIFEGVLRKYLIDDHGWENKDIGFTDLKKCFGKIKEELLDKSEQEVRSEIDCNGQPINFSANQIKQLLKYEAQYLDKWFSFITGFVDDSLYLNTKTKTIIDELNRHAILHEFGLGTDYSLENYLKVYMGIQFLTWIFLKKEGKSLLNNCDNFRFLEKVKAYTALIKSSEKLFYTKHTILRPYKGYKQEFFQDDIPFKEPDLLPAALNINYELIKRFDKYLWWKKLK